MSGTNPLNSIITEAVFKSALKDVCVLIGRTQPHFETLALFYKRVKHMDARDLIKACESEWLLKDWSIRKNLCWPTLSEAIDKARTDRLEAENARLKKRETYPADMPDEIRAQIDAIIGRSSMEVTHVHKN